MGLIFMIFGAALVAVLLAILIVKYLPLKLRWVVSILLLVVTVFLGYKIYNGIMAPINFNIKKKEIYSNVIKNLKIIRDAEVAHYQVIGKYTKDKAGLIQFLDTAQFALTETKNIVEKVNQGTKWQPIMIDVERRVTDTIGYEPVINRFKNRDYKNMFKVPGLTGVEFDLEVGEVEKIQGLTVSTFEAKVHKNLILKGMDNSLVKQELEALETDQIRGEYVSVGSLGEVTTGGNWPPSYDKGSAKKDD